jgi:fumarate hydratase class II
MRDACASFTRYAIQGLEPNRPRIEAHLRASLMLGTALVPHIGYDRAAAIALAAQRDGRTLRDAALTSGWVSGADFDAWVDPTGMARPHAVVPE